MRTAVDTNVLSAIWGRESTADGLVDALADARRSGSVVVCGAVFAEAVAYPGSTVAFVYHFVETSNMLIDFDMGPEAWAQAGQRYAAQAKRRRRASASNGETRRLLADFIIGSHALIHADRLMTLDEDRYRRDFPELKLFRGVL